MIRRIFFIFSLLLACYLLMVAFYFPSLGEETECSEVEVWITSDEKSKSLISKEQLLQEINAIDSLPIGREIVRFNAQKVEEQLLSINALVSQCQLFFRPNGTLVLSVHTQYPQFLLQTRKGVYFITARRKAISTTQANAIAVPLPVVYGDIDYPAPNSPASEEKIEMLFDAVDYVLKHPKWGKYFSDFYVDHTQNLFISGAVAGFVAEIGRDWTKIPKQLDNLDLFLSRVEPKFGCNAFSKLSLIVPGKVIATPRNENLSTLAMGENSETVEE